MTSSDGMQDVISLMFVKAESAHVVLLTELASLVLRIASSWRTLLVAPMGVQKGWREIKHLDEFHEIYIYCPSTESINSRSNIIQQTSVTLSEDAAQLRAPPFQTKTNNKSNQTRLPGNIIS